MKICAAQLKSKAGDIEFNIGEHTKLITTAIENSADLIFFPELSITGYEPTLAESLATDINDHRFDVFQKLSDENGITICVGMPIQEAHGIVIGFVILQPHISRSLYAKQLLHEDELPYFVQGKEQVVLQLDDEVLAPAICYESVQASHAEAAKQQGATIYFASVAKDQASVDRGNKHYAAISNQHRFITLMANCYGVCDNFESVGSSAIWDREGQCVARLGESENGIVGIDIATGESFVA